MIRETRRIQNSKQDKIQVVRSQPSVNSLREGQEVIYISKSNRLERYRKEQGRLWTSYMDTDNNYTVNKDLNVGGNLNLSNKLITSNYPAFSSHQSTSADGQTLADQNNSTIHFDSEIYDNGNNFDTSNYSFTAPYNGIYYFKANILLDGDNSSDSGDFDAGELVQLRLNKNDRSANASLNAIAISRFFIFTNLEDKFMYNSVSSDVKLEAGDYVSISVWHNSGVTQTTYATTSSSFTAFTGHLICAL
tara:strand:+ start:485 stop:1228 length:744 start_codon:yes stop_codon:yes gene_type:complete